MSAKKTYAGIGSRSTPQQALERMTALARSLDALGHTLYSGGADGADSAFEAGATRKVIFLPWDGFNGKESDGKVYIVPPMSLELVKRYHPNPLALTRGALAMMNRNSYQVLGLDLKSPVDFVVCWTPGGQEVGGTSQAMRIARDHGIPIYNLGSDGSQTPLDKLRDL